MARVNYSKCIRKAERRAQWAVKHRGRLFPKALAAISLTHFVRAALRRGRPA